MFPSKTFQIAMKVLKYLHNFLMATTLTNRGLTSIPHGINYSVEITEFCPEGVKKEPNWLELVSSRD